MASSLICRSFLRTSQRCSQPAKFMGLLPTSGSLQHKRFMQHYPVDDIVSGLTDEQIQVSTCLVLKSGFMSRFKFCISGLVVAKDGV